MKSESRYLYFLTLFYFIISFIGIIHHELWLDESHHWLLARDSSSVIDLIRNTHYEGHPILWNYLLFIITRFTLNPFWMQVLNILISTAAVFVFLRKAPFSWLFKTLFIFGYFMLFEYNLISRNYMIGVLFLFLACSVYKNREKKLPLLCFYLAIATNVHLIFAVISFALFLTILLDNYLKKELFTKPSNVLGYTIFGFGLFLLFLQIIQTDSNWFFASIKNIPFNEKFTIGFISLFKGLLTIPDFRTIHFWNTNLLVNLSKPIAALLGLLIYLVPLILFFKNRKMLFFVYTALLGSQVFFFMTQRGNTRSDGMVYIIIILALWLENLYTPDIQKIIKLDFFKKNIVYFILIIQLFSGITAYAIDYKYPFTSSKNVVNYLMKNKLDKKEIATITCDGTMLSSYLERKIYFLDEKSKQSYCHWEKITLTNSISDENVKKLVEEYANKNNFILISNYPVLKQKTINTWNYLNGTTEIKLLMSFNKNILENSSFSIYEVRKISSINSKINL